MSDEQEFTKWQIYTAAKPTVTRIIPELAAEIGLNESIVLMQIAFWIETSNNVRDGVYWTYQSMAEMKEKAFPYWSVDTIRRTVHHLHEMGYILIGQYNKRKGDNTQWYALEPDKLSTLKTVLVAPSDRSTPYLQNASMPSSQVATPPLQNRTTLPEIPTEIIKQESAPNGTDTQPIKSVTKEPTKREPNPMFDAVAQYVFEIEPETVTKEGGRIGILTAWLSGKSDGVKRGKKREEVGYISSPAKPEHVQMFAAHWKSVKHGADLPLDLVKFVDAWRQWATSVKVNGSKRIETNGKTELHSTLMLGGMEV